MYVCIYIYMYTYIVYSDDYGGHACLVFESGHHFGSALCGSWHALELEKKAGPGGLEFRVCTQGSFVPFSMPLSRMSATLSALETSN